MSFSNRTLVTKDMTISSISIPAKDSCSAEENGSLALEPEKFQFTISTLSIEQLNEWKFLIEQELVKRRNAKINELARLLKTLSTEEKMELLCFLQETAGASSSSVSPSLRRGKKLRDRLRMYQNYPNHEDPEYEVAPLVNLQLKEVFTEGNPNNKTWLAGLSIEERQHRYGTIKQLQKDSEFLEVLMAVPKAVFRKENGQWVECFKPDSRNPANPNG